MKYSFRFCHFVSFFSRFHFFLKHHICLFLLCAFCLFTYILSKFSRVMLLGSYIWCLKTFFYEQKTLFFYLLHLASFFLVFRIFFFLNQIRNSFFLLVLQVFLIGFSVVFFYFDFFFIAFKKVWEWFFFGLVLLLASVFYWSNSFPSLFLFPLRHSYSFFLFNSHFSWINTYGVDFFFFFLFCSSCFLHVLFVFVELFACFFFFYAFVFVSFRFCWLLFRFKIKFLPFS